MRRHHTILLTILLVFVCFPNSGFSESTPSLPWSLLPRMKALDEIRRNELIDVLKDESSYGKCKGTIFQCMVAKKPDPTAVRLANFGAYLVSRGVPPQSLGLFFAERAKFLNQEKPQTFQFADTPCLGNQKAGITIVEFAQFKCTYCVDLVPVMKKLVGESNGRVRFMFKHFPLKNYPGSFFSSRAAQAAHKQGKFWEMYEFLFRDFSRQTQKDVLEYAQTLGMDIERFKRDLENPKIERLIERDKMEGVRAKVQGTPTLFINGKKNNLRYDEDFLKDLVNEEAERLGIEPPYQDWVYIKRKP